MSPMAEAAPVTRASTAQTVQGAWSLHHGLRVTVRANHDKRAGVPHEEDAMHRRHLLAGFTRIGLSLLTAGRESADGAEACEHVTTTGRATVRRRCDGTRTEASVDHRITVRDPRVVRPTHERPVDRVRGRGEGRIHATGDKGASRELREKARRGH